MYISLPGRYETEAERRAQILQHSAAGHADRRGTAPAGNRTVIPLDHRQGLNAHRAGQRGEAAASLALGVPWPFNPGTYHGSLSIPDVGETVEVRTRRDPGYDLIVRDGDPPGRFYLLVIAGDVPGFDIEVVGGIWHADAVKGGHDSSWWKDPNGDGHAWFIPRRALQTVEQLLAHFGRGWL